MSSSCLTSAWNSRCSVAVLIIDGARSVGRGEGLSTQGRGKEELGGSAWKRFHLDRLPRHILVRPGMISGQAVKLCGFLLVEPVRSRVFSKLFVRSPQITRLGG